MAISSAFGFTFRPIFYIRPPLHLCVHKVKICAASAMQTFDEAETGESFKSSEWKRLSSKELGIVGGMIPKTTRVVLNRMKKEGFHVYLVGGCVRDLILQKTPKDFDILTSAELREVKRTFSRCEIVGRRFPICHVHIDDEIVEVSSFSTNGGRSQRHLSLSVKEPVGCDEHDFVRWRNCLQRDFTINSLMYDPYAKMVYDYLGGLADIRKARIRTIAPASLSLTEDCARILRAVRIAGRLGFRLAKETAFTVKEQSSSVLRLDRGRLLMEMNYMLAYGSAEASLRLLWRFGLLDVLLPIQAEYFVRHGFQRRDKRSNLLLSLLSNLDKYFAPDRPCHSSLWIALLAFHKGLSDHPSNPSVVAALGLAVHNGGDLMEASKIVKQISRQHDCSFPELLDSLDLGTKALIKEVKRLAASIQEALHSMTDEYSVSRAMADFPKAPYSDLVFVPLILKLRAWKIFECVVKGQEKGFVAKQGSKIDHELLALGSLQEVRHVFARVIFDTVYPINQTY